MSYYYCYFILYTPDRLLGHPSYFILYTPDRLLGPRHPSVPNKGHILGVRPAETAASSCSELLLLRGVHCTVVAKHLQSRK